VVEGFITSRHSPDEFEQAFGKPEHEDIKTLITWSS
jgi:hypothetical protein